MVNHNLEEMFFRAANAAKSRKDAQMIKALWVEVKKVLTIYEALLPKPESKDSHAEEITKVVEEQPDGDLLGEPPMPDLVEPSHPAE